MTGWLCFTILISVLLIVSTVIYILDPWRSIYANSNYEYYYTELMARVDVLIQETTGLRFDYEAVMEEKRLSVAAYNNLVKKTYTTVMSLIPSFILENLYEYLSKEEVETLVLYRINKVYQKHYGGGSILPSEDFLDNDTGTVKNVMFDVNGKQI